MLGWDVFVVDLEGDAGLPIQPPWLSHSVKGTLCKNKPLCSVPVNVWWRCHDDGVEEGVPDIGCLLALSLSRVFQGQ